MKYRSNVKTQIRSFLDETTTDNWTDTELNALINVYFHKVRSAVISSFEDYYLTTDLFNTTADQEEYTSTDGIATDIYKIRRVEVNYNPSATNSAPTRCLPVDNIDAIRRDLSYTNASAGIASNAFYYKYGFGSNITIGLIPKPSETSTGAGKIWYIPLGTDISDDTTVIDIPNPDQNYMLIAYGATADALKFGQVESDEGDKFEAKFNQGIAILQEEMEDYIAEETKMVLDVTG